MTGRDPLAALAGRFPIPLTRPWERDWVTEILVVLSEGLRLAFVADGRALSLATTLPAAPHCTVRCSREQLLRLLAGFSVIVLTFEGVEVDEMGDLMALQSVFLGAGGPLGQEAP